VIEVHLVRLELPTTVCAWLAAKVSQKLDHASLPYPNALELEIAIPAVVLNVVGSLAGSWPHD
jgi:hypothetical protein